MEIVSLFNKKNLFVIVFLIYLLQQIILFVKNLPKEINMKNFNAFMFLSSGPGLPACAQIVFTPANFEPIAINECQPKEMKECLLVYIQDTVHFLNHIFLMFQKLISVISSKISTK